MNSAWIYGIVLMFTAGIFENESLAPDSPLYPSRRNGRRSVKH